MLKFVGWITLSGSRRGGWTLVVVAGVLAGLLWWNLTPPGLLGKADAVGYAVCHRIDGRSFHLGDRQLPLCARCSGMYLGALFGVLAVAAMGRARAGGLPPLSVSAVLVGFMALMAVDGVNSYLTFLPKLPHLYEPNNLLRLVTGTLNGMAMGVFLYPVFNQTIWRHWDNRRAVASLRELAGLVLLGAVLVGLILSENPMVLYPLALLSAMGVLALLLMVNITLVLLVTRRENRAEDWRGALVPMCLGLTLAIVQIGALDFLRYSLTGTWAGFSL